MKPYFKLLLLALLCHIFGIATFGFAGAQLLDRHLAILEGHFGVVLRNAAKVDYEKETWDGSG